MRHLIITLSIGLALTAAGCSAAPPASAPVPSTAAVPAAPAPATSVPTQASPTVAAPEAELPVLASRNASIGGKPVRVAVRELRVAGELTLLTWSVTNVSDRSLLVDGFDDHVYATDPATKQRVPTEISGPVDGVYLLDAVNKKRYLNARDPQGGCVCSFTVGVGLEAGETVLLQNVYQAVPAGVASIGVVIPGAGAFRDVPVGR